MKNLQQMIEETTLAETILALTQHLKGMPTDTQSRTALFELLSITGEYDRAEKQLQALDSQNETPDPALRVYAKTLGADRNRQNLLLAKTDITFVIPPPDYISHYVSAIEQYAKGEFEEAQNSIEAGESLRPKLAGTLNGKPFSDLRDYHDLLSPVLEMIIDEHYIWLPFDQLKSIRIYEPNHLRDVIWTTAQVETKVGQVHFGFIPSIYVNSHSQTDELVRTGRKTAWGNLDSEFPIVFGLKELLVDDEEVTIFDIDNIQFS